MASVYFAAASLSFFGERTFSFTLAGFAANSRSTLVKESIPRRFFFAGTCTTAIFNKQAS